MSTAPVPKIHISSEKPETAPIKNSSSANNGHTHHSADEKCHNKHNDYVQLDKLVKKTSDNATLDDEDFLKSGKPLVYQKFQISNPKKTIAYVQNRENDFKVPNVSFDTVPINGISGSYCPPGQKYIPMDYTEEEYYDNENVDGPSMKGFVNGQDGSPTAPDITGSSKANPAMDGLLHALVLGKDGKLHRCDYPSRPSVKSSALVVTKSHKYYDILKEREAFKEKTVLKKRLYREILARPPPPITTVSSITEEKVRQKYIKQLKQNGGDTNDAMQRKLKKINREYSGFLAGPRVLLVHISGRKNTWVAMDYVLQKIANNGDHIVIVANLPALTPYQKKRLETKLKARMRARINRRRRKMLEKKSAQKSKPASPATSSNINPAPKKQESLRKTTRGRAAHITDGNGHSYYEFSDGVVFSETESEEDACDSETDEDEESDFSDFDDEWSEGYSFENVRSALDDIMKYALVLLPQDKIVKLTVEVTIGSVKKMFTNAINCYFPQLIFASSNRFKSVESLVVWRRKGLCDVLANFFPVPVVIVPLRKLDYFEYDLLREIRNDVEQGNKVNGTEALSGARPPMPFMKQYPGKESKNLKRGKLLSSGKTSAQESTNMLASPTRNEFSSSDVESVYSNADSDSEYDSDDEEENEAEKREKEEEEEEVPAESQTPVLKLEHLLQHSKTQLDQRLSQLNNAKNLSSSEKTSKTIDCILDESLSFNNKLHLIKSDKEQDRSFDKLQKVITGKVNTKATKLPPPISSNSSSSKQTTLNNYYAPHGGKNNNGLSRTKTYSVPSSIKKRQNTSSSSRAGSPADFGFRTNSQSIRFAEAPKKPSSTSKHSPANLLRKLKSNDSSFEDNNELRKIKSSFGRLNTSRSNDSSKSSLSTDSSSKKPKKKSFFKSLFGLKSDN